MSLLLKSTYVHIFTAAVIFATYGFWVFGILGVEYFTGQDALIRIGQSIGILIIGRLCLRDLSIDSVAWKRIHATG